ncbi:MAG: ABC transporter permease subunit, partial [Frankiaceae bacterium]|nr:ABC transporter permease subunit [Frankiaceae bacterium]
EAGAATADSGVGTAVGGDGPGANGPMAQGYQQLSGSFAVTGSGDIGPASGPGAGRPAERSLVGGFAGLVAIIVVAALFMTSEYRRGLIRVTLAASPRRGRVLAAKAVVVGVASFAIGLIAATVSLKLGNHLAYSHGANVLPISAGAQARLIVGTAAIFAVVAVFALALGALARRSAAAVTAALAMIVLPYILATSSVLPAGAAQWLARLTPAAGFAVQPSLVAWPQVSAAYTPDNGYFPLAPWVGLAVLCAWAAAALGLAYRQLQRRDA